jgi:CBS domain-containing protein
MATVRELLARKGADVVSVPPTASVLDAARRMNERGTGSVLVIDDAQQLVGMFTERDILRRVVAAGLAATTTRVREVLTAPVITCLPETSVEECAAIMTTRRIRHLPVVDAGGRLHGVVSSGDVLAHQAAEYQATIQYLNGYMFDLR